MGEFTGLMTEHGFADVDLNPENGREDTYNLQMRTEVDAVLTVPALKRQIAQTVEQLPANKGVTWRVNCIVVLIEGQIVRAQFKVAPRQQSR